MKAQRSAAVAAIVLVTACSGGGTVSSDQATDAPRQATATDPADETTPEPTADDEGPEAAPGGGLSRGGADGSGSSLSRGGGVEAPPLERRALELLGDLEAGQTELGALVEVPDDVLFDFDEDVLKPGADGVLDDLAELAALTGEVPVSVTGHTDGRGSDAYNLDLSRRRAQAVVDALVERGVDASRLVADGVGSQQPLLEEGGPDDEAARARNRRVEVVFEGVRVDQ